MRARLDGFKEWTTISRLRLAFSRGTHRNDVEGIDNIQNPISLFDDDIVFANQYELRVRNAILLAIGCTDD